MPEVLNRNRHGVPQDATYVGRPSRWGNPFKIGRDGDRDEVIAKYRSFLNRSPELKALAREELAGRDLVCWCAPEPCHADVLLEVANDA